MRSVVHAYGIGGDPLHLSYARLAISKGLEKNFANYKMALAAAQHYAGGKLQDKLSNRLFGDYTEHSKGRAAEHAEQLRLARDIFGNPFRPIAFDPAWRTGDTAGIAARMYDSRDFAAMPVLADALEEAGCTNSDVLLHCREPSIHVRGCWVVDSVLGKC